jgi:hypothetical protein
MDFLSFIPYLTAASAGVSAFSAIRQGKAAEAAGEYNADIQRQNAAFAREEADELVRIADRETYLRLGAIRAAQGANGGVAGEGSVFDVLADTAAESERERQYIVRSGEMKAQGFESTAGLELMEGRSARSASYMRAGSELLSGTANAYAQRDRLTRRG